MKIGFISPVDPRIERIAWSGTYYNTFQSIQSAGHSVEWIGYPNNGITDKLFRRISRFYFGKGNYVHTRFASWSHSKIPQKLLNKYDVIFIPGQAEVLAGISTDTPVIYYSDATIPLMIDYYWFGFSEKSIQEAKRIERKGLEKATLRLFSSNWAAKSATNDYGIDPTSIHVIPFGGGLDEKLIHPHLFTEKREINILFSGVDWKRKGGDIAVQAVKELNNRGINAALTICGIKELDPKIEALPFVKNVGFKNKNNKSDLLDYINVWENTDILILPTRAECSAIVFGEANGYGVPILSTDTGGVETYVKNGKNGQRLSLSATSTDYADVLQNWIENNQLRNLGEGALEMAQQANSWLAWQKTFNNILKLI